MRKHNPQERMVAWNLACILSVLPVTAEVLWAQPAVHTIVRQSKRIPVAYDVDVVVVGGSSAGVAAAWQWPVPDEEATRYYFHSAHESRWQDDVTVDYSTTTDRATRWTNGYEGDSSYPDMTSNDEKGLTYTPPPLDTDLELSDCPVVRPWVSSTAPDGDFFVYLEEVEELRGRITTFRCHYTTEGPLRASDRAISTPPYDNLSLPYHRSFAEDIAELPVGEPVELVFDLHPTSNILAEGRRIEKAVRCQTQVKHLYHGDHCIVEYDAADALLRKLIHGPCVERDAGKFTQSLLSG